MNFLGIGNIISGVGNIADDLFTSDEERLKMALEEKKINAALVEGQHSINREEAKHGSIFVAGWRPFIGWIGGIALAYQFALYPLLVWFWAIAQANQWIPCHLPLDPSLVETIAKTTTNGCTVTPPPVLDSGPLFAIVTGMLGIGTMRSYDKLKQTDTKTVGQK